MEIHFNQIERSDLPFINEVRNASCEYLHNPSKFTLDQTGIWYDQVYLNTSGYWFIVYVDNQPIGYLRRSIQDDKHYIGMDIHPNHRGKGYSKAIYKEFISYRYKVTKTKDLWLEVLKTNPRAIHIYESLGFEKVDEYDFSRDGEITTSYVYKLNLEKWFNTQ